MAIENDINDVELLKIQVEDKINIPLDHTNDIYIFSKPKEDSESLPQKL